MEANRTDQILQTLDDLCHLEAAMAAYYLACSEKWGVKSSLWMELAMEEEHHEKVLRDLCKIVETHPEQFRPGLAVEPTAIASYIDNITEMIKDIHIGKVNLHSALTFALGIEESIIEGRFFEVIVSQHQTYLKFMEAMGRDLADHRQRIIEEMEKSSE